MWNVLSFKKVLSQYLRNENMKHDGDFYVMNERYEQDMYPFLKYYIL
jgi:hypothetical protein